MIDDFLKLLASATKDVLPHYFDVPVAGQDGPIYRERVYCYELYHQLRLLLEKDEQLRRFVLAGEIDKSGHPIIRRFKPDFILHWPGEMEFNLVVMEVKPASAYVGQVEVDIDKLEYVLSDDPRYQLGIELVFGGTETDIVKFEQAMKKRNNPDLLLYWHHEAGKEAQVIEITTQSD